MHFPWSSIVPGIQVQYGPVKMRSGGQTNGEVIGGRTGCWDGEEG